MLIIGSNRWGKIRQIYVPSSIFSRTTNKITSRVPAISTYDSTTSNLDHLADYPASNLLNDGTLNRALCISPSALSLLLVFLQVHKSWPPRVRAAEVVAKVRIEHEKLMQRTGYTKNIITKAIQELTRLRC
jgi:hypothetical protein